MQEARILAGPSCKPLYPIILPRVLTLTTHRIAQWIIESLEHEKPHDSFPPTDLLNSLVDLYFQKCNLYLPLLHRPTLEKGISDGLHLTDEGFGSVLLLVCALGARFSDDPRVILQGSNSQHSAGWEWFRQVQWIRRSLLSPPRLYDLQVACVSTCQVQTLRVLRLMTFS